jgi:hypothetical protein
MLQAVKDSCDKGKYIFVVMPNEILAKEAQRSFEAMLPSFEGVPTFEHANGKTYWNGGQVSWESCRGSGWDWRSMMFRGAHPSCVYFVDPSCVEIQFHHLLEAWHRFDAGAHNATHQRAATRKLTTTQRLIRRSVAWVCYAAIEVEAMRYYYVEIEFAGRFGTQVFAKDEAEAKAKAEKEMRSEEGDEVDVKSVHAEVADKVSA